MQPLLDPESVISENQIRAMHTQLNSEQEERAKKLR